MHPLGNYKNGTVSWTEPLKTRHMKVERKELSEELDDKTKVYDTNQSYTIKPKGEL